MTIIESIKAFGEVQDFIETGLPELAATIASQDTIAQISNRVIETGIDKDGDLFSSYSENEVPASSFLGKGYNAGLEAKLKSLSKKGIRISYKGLRSEAGLKTAFKNFSFSTEMWKGFGLKRTEHTPKGFTLFLGGKTSYSQDLIDKHSEYEGVDIIENNKEEADHFEEVFKLEMEDKIKALLK